MTSPDSGAPTPSEAAPPAASADPDSATAVAEMPSGAPPPMEARDVNAYFNRHHALEDVSITFPANTVTALIGPSGCGKSTFIRCLNRMHELVPFARMEGAVMLHGNDIYARDADPVAIRRGVGMVFQRPNPFPTKSIADNVKDLAPINKAVESLTPKMMAEDIGVPFHPGAAKFYKEKGAM